MFRLRLFLPLFSILLLATAWFAWAQEPSSPRHAARWLTVHEYGIQVRVEPPQAARAPWTLRVRDLGPAVSHLRLDLPPTAAQLRVSGYGRLSLQREPNGDLLAQVPFEWLPHRLADQVHLRVESGAQTLLDCSVDGLFL